MIKISKTLSLINDYGEIINADYYESQSSSSPILILSHGFKAYRKWGFFPFISEKISDIGINVLNFDFSLNAVDNPERGTYIPEVFKRNTVSSQIEDVCFVINYIKNELNPGNWNGEIYLMGHSLGGAVSIIVSSLYDFGIKKLVLWGTISTLDRNTPRQKKLWREKGTLEFKINSTGQELELDVEYLEDKERNAEKYNLVSNISKVKSPILIVHGKKDFTVKPIEAERLHLVSKDYSELCIIEKCNHTFNTRNPMTESNEVLESALDKTIEFLIR